MVSGVVVSPLNMCCQLVTQIEFLPAETSHHFRISFVLGFVMIFQTLVPRECRAAKRTVDLFSILFRNVLCHVGRKIALQESTEAAHVAEESFHFVVDFVDVPLQLILVVEVAT